MLIVVLAPSCVPLNLINTICIINCTAWSKYAQKRSPFSKIITAIIFIEKKVLDVLRVDDKRFSVQINMYFGVLWTEERLKLPKNSNTSAPVSWLPIDLNFMNHLWVPNVFVYNLAAFETLECLQKLSSIWIVENKDLFYNQVIRYNI